MCPVFAGYNARNIVAWISLSFPTCDDIPGTLHIMNLIQLLMGTLKNTKAQLKDIKKVNITKNNDISVIMFIQT